MDEIIALQAALAKAQLADTAHRISERNAVEVVLKLIELKKVQLLFTKSGREYVTPAQVVEELDTELLAAGGRLTLTDVAPLLGLDLHHVETAARTLCSRKKIVDIAGQLVADYYLDTMVEEINESLQQSGSVALLELAQKFALPADVMREAIEQRMGSGGSLQGYIEEGQLYTASFIQLHAARTRGILRALSRPTALRTLIQRHGLMESRLAKEIAALLQEGSIAGSLKGAEDRAIYTPELYIRAQHSGVDSFFATNGYVEYSKLERLSIAAPKAFLASKYPTALQLRSLALSEGLVSSVAMACEDALSAGTFVNAQAILPNVLSRAEVEQVLTHAVQSVNAAPPAAAGADQTQLHVLAETWAVSSGLQAEVKAHLTAQLELWADEEAAKLEAAAAAAAAAATATSSNAAPSAAVAASNPAAKVKKAPQAESDSDDDSSSAASSKKGAKGGKKGAAADEPVASKGKDKKKASRRKKGGDSDSDDDAPAEPSAAKTKGKIKQPSAAVAAPLTRDRLLRWLKSGWASIVRAAQQKHSGSDAHAGEAADDVTDELLQALVGAEQGPLIALYKTTMAKRAAALAAAAGASGAGGVSSSAGSSLGPGSDALLRRQQLECFRTNVQEAYEQAAQYQQAIEYLGGAATTGGAADEKLASPASAASPVKADKHLLSQLEAHLCKTLCAALLDLLIRQEAYVSLSLAQQNSLPGMDNIIVLAPAAATSAEEKDASPAAKAAARFEINRTPLSSKEREAALAALPKRVGDALASLAEAVSKEPVLFLERLDACARSGALDVSLRKLDKKAARSRVFATRKALMASASTEERPAVLLHLATLLLFAKQHGVVPHAPAKCIPAIRRLLRPDAQPAAYARLRRYNQLVQRALRAGSDADDSAASSGATAAASGLGGASDSEDDAADEALPLEEQVKHLSAAAVAQELTAGIETIRKFANEPATALRETKAK